ncbi:Response regulator of the LytR/AlgR family protein [Salinivirga cyanobacteriivorans]|uniref:Response regulator of the LytR/AlgR family protein n=1 Tax=Salinivirga cyanobacteriivorans TaxID=1307839 RepID=A0A0S2I1T4_9BACT|nr:LytTR family DNA-binding domain-containing protein [Salinivirga cyanobacteriivorans]ALO16294.1 Response regulator of the LytR/AlgR family protein [Salinivirga cyanobacteriivorans]
MIKIPETGFVTVSSDYEQMRIPFESIMYIEARKNYVILHTFREKVISNTPLRVLLYDLPVRLFIQTHRNYVVAISQVNTLEPSRVTLINNEKVPLSKNYRKPLINTLLELGVIDKGF